MRSKFIVWALLSCLFLMNLTSLSMIQRQPLPTFGELQIQLFQCREQVDKLTSENQLLRAENAQLRAQLKIAPAAPAIIKPKPIPTLPNPNFELFAGPAPIGYHYIYKIKIDDQPETEWALVPRYENKEQPISLQFTKQLVLTAALTKDLSSLIPLIETKRTFSASPDKVYFCIIMKPSTRVDLVGPQILPQDYTGPISGQWEVVPHTATAKRFANEIKERFERIQKEKSLPKNWRQ